MDALGAAVIGGTALFGGRGNVIASISGVLVLAVLNTGLQFIQVEPAVQLAAKGALVDSGGRSQPLDAAGDSQRFEPVTNTEEGTMELLEAARESPTLWRKKPNRVGIPVTFCAIDIHGNVILKLRMTGSILVSIEMSERKAYTSAALPMRTARHFTPLAQPGHDLYTLVAGGRHTMLGGGVPLHLDGKHVEVIGVSGGTTEQDIDIIESASCWPAPLPSLLARQWRWPSSDKFRTDDSSASRLSLSGHTLEETCTSASCLIAKQAANGDKKSPVNLSRPPSAWSRTM